MNDIMPAALRRYWFQLSVFFLVLAAAWLFLWNIGASSISLRSDEVIYARVAQSVVHNGDLFPLAHGNAPTYEKPPLKLWCSALVLALFGESNLTFRALDGAFGVVAVLLTVLLAKQVTGSPAVAILSASALLAMPELVISHHGFRRAVLDGMLTVFTLLAALYTWRMLAEQDSNRPAKRGYAIIIGAICSCAVLTKSVAGFFPALCALSSLAVCGGWLGRAGAGGLRRFVEQRSWVWIAFLPLVTFLSYAALLGLVAGIEALGVFLGVEIYTRVFSGFSGHNTGQGGFYWWYLFVRGAATPRVLLSLGTLAAIVAAIKRDRRYVFLLIWGYLPVVIYSLAASRVPWYINPFLPFLSIISFAGAAVTLAGVRARFGSVARAALVAALVILALPPFVRASWRNVKTVANDTERIELDLFVERHMQRYESFAILEDALSGRSNPRLGRFNLEGIYREMLRYKLRSVKDLGQFEPRQKELVLVREESLGRLPSGWREVQRVQPFFARPWTLVGVEYEF